MRLAEMENERRDLLLRTDELDRKAHEDDLTGLKIDALPWMRWPNASRIVRSANACLSLLSMLTTFKAINDQFGHSVGDQVLQTLAQLLQVGIGPDNLAARLGSEEFLLAVSSTAAQAIALCNALIATIADHPWQDGLAVIISVGLAVMVPSDTVHSMLGRTDGALYRSKSGRRNRLTTNI
ncbi:MAG: GGDEF domain-containing protein [Candidatus Devosia symbiotica]|nr:GGDEF domain-containing protein [Candidatus Devosia symbiotica]